MISSINNNHIRLRKSMLNLFCTTHLILITGNVCTLKYLINEHVRLLSLDFDSTMFVYFPLCSFILLIFFRLCSFITSCSFIIIFKIIFTTMFVSYILFFYEDNHYLILPYKSKYFFHFGPIFFPRDMVLYSECISSSLFWYIYAFGNQIEAIKSAPTKVLLPRNSTLDTPPNIILPRCFNFVHHPCCFTNLLL